MDIPKLMIKCCRLIVLIRASVFLPFHKCLRLLHLGLYTVSTPCVDNDVPIVPYICYISLLRCNYYDKCLACEQQNFCDILLFRIIFFIRIKEVVRVYPVVLGLGLGGGLIIYLRRFAV